LEPGNLFKKRKASQRPPREREEERSAFDFAAPFPGCGKEGSKDPKNIK